MADGEFDIYASVEDFRRVRVDRDFQLPRPQIVELLCECGQPGCTGRIVLSVSAYEAVRAFPTRFPIKEGHDVPEGDWVVDYGTGYVVIAKDRREVSYAGGPAVSQNSRERYAVVIRPGLDA